MSKSNDNYKDHLYALIGIGGGGTRLWPRSRNSTPKQFLPLFGKQTLAQITAYRFNKILPWEKIYCVTVSSKYKKEILFQIPEFIPENIIVEPARRETGPAYALGALIIHKADPNAVIINAHADHIMNPENRYLKTMSAASEAAYSGNWLVATGIRPTYPHVGYGYIKYGEKHGKFSSRTVYKLQKFTEKPELALAMKYLNEGDYLWNAGQYVWRADSILKAFKTHEKEIYDLLMLIQKDLGTKNEDKTINDIYEKMPKIAIDYAISERADNFLVIPADYSWTDVGDWNEVWKELSKDASGNVIIDGNEKGGDIINIDTSDALIHKNGRMIAVIDVDNVVIVDTKDALLVCSKSKAQNVKKIVNQLKEKNRQDLL